MNYSSSYCDSISTVQLSPFAEDQWNRIVTYSPIYVHWTDYIMMPQKQATKTTRTSTKRNLLSLIDVNSMKLDDEILLNELHDIRRPSAISKYPKVRENHHEARFLDDEHDRNTTSPTDEYQQSPEFIRNSVEPSKHHSNYINSCYNRKSARLQSRTKPTERIQSLANINFGPKPQASLGVQLRQSAITREHALANHNDYRIASPLPMGSSRRTGGSAHSSRRLAANQQPPLTHCQTPQTQTNETSLLGGFYEQLSTDSLSSTKKSNARSTNSSRTALHMLKTKNERARQKQQVELKTILVTSCQASIDDECDLEESIPNSIEIMRRLGGSVSAFEKNLRSNYQRQLTQFRANSKKF